jgi:hypothetical protein
MPAKRKTGRPFATQCGPKDPATIARLGLLSLARYRLSELAQPGEHMHEELAVRLAQVASRNRW